MAKLDITYKAACIHLCRPPPKTGKKSSGGGPLASASQPCLIEKDKTFPHLVKPNRVSTEAFQLRKLRLLKHKYEDIDIREWAEVGGAPGGVGDVPSSPTLRDSWLEAEKESGELICTQRHTNPMT